MLKIAQRTKSDEIRKVIFKQVAEFAAQSQTAKLLISDFSKETSAVSDYSNSFNVSQLDFQQSGSSSFHQSQFVLPLAQSGTPNTFCPRRIAHSQHYPSSNFWPCDTSSIPQVGELRNSTFSFGSGLDGFETDDSN